jgi:SRSO17 transposase
MSLLVWQEGLARRDGPRYSSWFVNSTKNAAVAVGHTLDPGGAEALFRELMGRVAGRFGRVEPRRAAERMVRGLLAELPRKNCRTIAEQAGDTTPAVMQSFLSRGAWDHDGVRDDLRDFVVGRLGTGGVLLLDETGDVKKGLHTAGVQRQYSGTASRVENTQVAMCAVWAAARGAAFIDRELYIPRSWTDDPAPCAAAGLPQDLVFATKPALALRLIERSLAAEARPGWVAADEVYGNDPTLRAALEQHRIGYVLATARSMRISVGPARLRVDDLAEGLPEHCWQTRAAGTGAKGPRRYQWAYLHLDEPEPPEGGQRYLLIPRNPATGETAFYRRWAPAPASLNALIRTAAIRWKVEEAFQTAKGLAGPHEHQVRRYCS